MALPAIADVRNKRRDAPLGIAARASVAPLFSLVDGVEVNAHPLSHYDTAILLPNSFHSAMLVSRAGVRERWGYRADWRGLLLTRAIDRPPAGVHQIDYYQRLVAALGFVNGPSAPRLEVAPAVREAGSALRRRATLIDVVGQTDIPALAGVLGNCRALMANDSGALHLGAAIGLNVTAAFGPTDERLSAPRSLQSPVISPQSVVLTHQAWCRPCGLRECPLDHVCMTGIAAADALAATRKHL